MNKQDHKRNHFYTFEDLEVEEAALNTADNRQKMGAGKALSILLVPIILILLGSFVPLAVGEDAAITPIVKFLGDKNFAMMAGVIYATLISRKYQHHCNQRCVTNPVCYCDLCRRYWSVSS